MNFTRYETKDGDRLDLICAAMFGDPHNWALILDNNPDLPVLDSYEGGIKLNIPIIEKGTGTLTNNLNLPPWKQ